MASGIRYTRLFRQIVARLGLAADEPAPAVSQARMVFDLFKSDSSWRPGQGAVIWNRDEIEEIASGLDPLTAAAIDRACAGEPLALLRLLSHPRLQGMVVVSVDAHSGDWTVESSLAERALRRHGDEAARIILSDSLLCDQPAMEPLAWVAGVRKVAPPRDGSLAFQALDYVSDLSLVFDYPDLWSLAVDPGADTSETWIERAESLAVLRNDPALFRIRKARQGARPSPVAASSSRRLFR